MFLDHSVLSCFLLYSSGQLIERPLVSGVLRSWAKGALAFSPVTGTSCSQSWLKAWCTSIVTRSLEGVLARRSMQTCALVTLSRNYVTSTRGHVFA